MTKWQYEMLQDLLTRKAENNPYGRSGNFKYEEGYKQGILAEKKHSIRFLPQAVRGKGGLTMNRNTADRIIVTSNARMERVLDWYFDNFKWLDREKFLAPMESGVVELCEEQIEFTFESKGSWVEMAVYITVKPNLPPVVMFDYDPATTEIRNRRIAPMGSQPVVDQELLSVLLSMDDTCRKEARKYHALMLFMAYYREEVKVEQRIERRPAKHKKKKRTAQVRQPLIRHIYTVTDFDSTALVKPEQAKRGYTKPDHEVNVRGHLRRYKSGKVVWVKPSVKYKGKTARHKEYEL